MPGEGAQVGKAYVRVLPDTKGFGKELSSQVDNESSGLSNTFGKVGKAAAAAFSIGAVGAGIAGAAIFKIGTETQDALNIFEVAAHATGDEMQRVSGLARDLGNDVMLPGASAKDAAIAMSELAKAGFSVQESMDAAKGTLQLAAAAGIDAGTAAQISSNAINAFGLNAGDAARVADLLAGAANSASGEITDVAQALQQSGSVYASAGVNIEDLTTAIAEMANQGILGSDAGTSLKTMLLSLQAPTDKSKKVMDDLGISIYDSSGNMRDFRNIVDQFGSILPNLTQAQRDQALATIFGTDAVRAANIVLGEGVEGFDKMKAAVTEQGAAQKIAEARMKGLGGAIEGLKSQLETLALDAFNLLAPYAEAFVRWLSDALPKALQAAGDGLSWFGDHIVGPTVDWFSENIPKAITAAGQAFTWLQENVIAPLVKWFKDNWPTIKEVFQNAWNALQTGFEWLLDHKAVLIAAVAAIAAVILGPFVTAIAAGVIAYQKLEGFREVVDNIVLWVQQTLIPAIQSAWKWLQDNTAALALYIGERWADIQKAFDNVVTYLKVVFAVVLAPIVLIWQAAHDQILGIVTVVWENIKLIIDTTIRVIKDIVDVVLGLLSGDWGRAWDAIKDMLGAVWDLMVGTVRLGLDAMKLILEGALEVLKAVWAGAWEIMKQGLSAAWEAIKGIVSAGVTAVVDFVKGLPQMIVDALVGTFDAGWDAGRNLADGFIKGLLSKAGDILVAVGNAIPGGLGDSGTKGAVVAVNPDGSPKTAGGGYFDRPQIRSIAEQGGEVILNNRQAARVLWGVANGAVVPRGGDMGTTVSTTINGVASDPQELARINAAELTWALRTRAA